MSILDMQKINICGLKTDRKQILEALQRFSIVQISNKTFDDKYLQKIDTKAYVHLFAQSAKAVKEALTILEKYTRVNTSQTALSLNGKKKLSKLEYYKIAETQEKLTKIAKRIIFLKKSISANKAAILKLNAEIESIEPWAKLDLALKFKGTKKTRVLIGTLPGKLDIKSILAKFYEENPKTLGLELNVINYTPEQICIFAICCEKDYEKVEYYLKQIGFLWPVFSSLDPPSLQKEKCMEKVKDLEKQNFDNEQEIESFNKHYENLQFILDYHNMRSEKYKKISLLNHTKHVFILSGFIAKQNAKTLKDFLNKNFSVTISIKDPDPNEDIPVLLKNNAFSAPVESVLESYSLPGKGEIDPTGVMAFFYYVLFGLMLSDAAYGLIMVLGCGGFLLKFRNMKDSLKKTLQMFLFCGISTMFWGIMFGSYFGDLISVVAKTYFNTNIYVAPIWFEPLHQPMKMLAFSFGIGILHIFMGLILRFYNLLKLKQYKDAIFDVVSWILLIGGGIIFALTMPMVSNMLTLGWILPAEFSKIACICVFVGAILILFTAGRESKNPFKRFLKGIYALYGVSSYLSDILSYSRLLALGLATGVIAQVFNKLSTMAGNSVIGVIIFLIILLIGHTMNIGINLLGAYVHTNRLQFVEFFSKFYEGGGTKFSPFSLNTKYYKITEDINNE